MTNDSKTGFLVYDKYSDGRTAYRDRNCWQPSPSDCSHPFVTMSQASEWASLSFPKGTSNGRMVVIDLTGKQVWPEVATDSTEVEALRKQVADLTKEKESFHHDYRLRFDVRQKQLDIQVADLTAEVVRLKDQRRERIATAALQGLLAVPVDAPSKTFAIGALTAADALIAKLDGKEN